MFMILFSWLISHIHTYLKPSISEMAFFLHSMGSPSLLLPPACLLQQWMGWRLLRGNKQKGSPLLLSNFGEPYVRSVVILMFSRVKLRFYHLCTKRMSRCVVLVTGDFPPSAGQGWLPSPSASQRGRCSALCLTCGRAWTILAWCVKGLLPRGASSWLFQPQLLYSWVTWFRIHRLVFSLEGLHVKKDLAKKPAKV